MVSIPHAGVFVPEEIRQRFTPAAETLRDTDWFLDRLYRVPELENASRIVANVSRYVVDLNRSADNQSLYPGQNTTGLCPEVTFAGLPIYRDDQQIPSAEVQQRVATYWQPYHDQLSRELDRLVSQFGFVVLLDAHSIANQVPRLFPGVLPDFNFGTNRGASCSDSLQQEIESFASDLKRYTQVVNGRFVGGFITRHYGARERVQAVQLELSQATYMDQQLLEWSNELSRAVQPVIRSFLDTLIQWTQR